MSDINPDHPEVKALTSKGLTHAQITKLVNDASIEHEAVSSTSATSSSTSAATPSTTSTPATNNTVPTLDPSVQQALAQSGPELQYMFQEDNQGNPTPATGQAQQVVTPQSQTPTPQNTTLNQQQYNQLLAQMVPGAFNG
jgi:hypothetical protein